MSGLMEHMGVYLEEVGGELYVDSLQVAERFGKEHFHVLRDIENIECSQAFRESNFGLSHYRTKQGRKAKKYRMTRDGFTFLAMGFTGPEAAQWKDKEEEDL